jgi:hypothetical protein
MSPAQSHPLTLYRGNPLSGVRPIIDDCYGRITMPRIVVTTEPRGSGPEAAVLLDERIVTTDLASGHFAAQLIERIGWALLDADGNEPEPRHGVARRAPAWAASSA